MLDVMRSNAKSSLIVLIFGAIIVTFIFSFGRGSSGFRTRTPETWAARVNGEMVTASDFTQAYTSRFRQMSQVRGGKYTTDDALSIMSHEMWHCYQQDKMIGNPDQWISAHGWIREGEADWTMATIWPRKPSRGSCFRRSAACLFPTRRAHGASMRLACA